MLGKGMETITRGVYGVGEGRVRKRVVFRICLSGKRIEGRDLV